MIEKTATLFRKHHRQPSQNVKLNYGPGFLKIQQQKRAPFCVGVRALSDHKIFYRRPARITPTKEIGGRKEITPSSRRHKVRSEYIQSISIHRLTKRNLILQGLQFLSCGINTLYCRTRGQNRFDT